MRPQSAKSKGRRLQQQVAEEVRRAFSLEPDDVRSTSMGAAGEDVQLSPAARACFPFSLECKNVERLNVWSAWEQARANAKGHTPALVIKKNRTEALCVLPWAAFLELARNTPHGVRHQDREDRRDDHLRAFARELRDIADRVDLQAGVATDAAEGVDSDDDVA